MAHKVHIRFLKPGLFTTIQDQGRIGFQAFGVPIGGPLDKRSANQANSLVGNEMGSPLLEITFAGPEMIFDAPCQIAITGADISPMVNEIAINPYQTIQIQAGDKLHFGRLQSGCRAYLAIGGEWEVPRQLESAGLLFQGKIKPCQLGRIEKGTVLTIHVKDLVSPQTVPLEERINLYNLQIISVLPGPEFNWFSSLEIARFFSETYKITPDSNRMGYRLEGYGLKRDKEKELISSGIIPGTIQIPHNGIPLVLLADAQTLGGYPRIAVICSEDLDLMGQMKPGDQIRFKMKQT